MTSFILCIRQLLEKNKQCHLLLDERIMAVFY